MKKLLNVYSSLKKDRSLFSLSFLIEFAWNLLLIELLDRLMAYSAQSDLCLFSKTSVLFCIGAVIFVLLVFPINIFPKAERGWRTQITRIYLWLLPEKSFFCTVPKSRRFGVRSQSEYGSHFAMDVNGCCEHHSSNISAAGISFDPTSS